MKKKIIIRILKILAIIIAILIILVGVKIYKFRKNVIKDIRVTNSVIEEKMPYTPEKRNLIEVSIEDKVDAKKIEGVTLQYNGKKIYSNSNIFIKNLRYYLNIKDILNEIGVEYTLDKDKLSLNKDIIVDLKKKEITKHDKSVPLRGEVLEINNNNYISLNDLEYILNLRDKWDLENKYVYLFNEKKDIVPETVNENSTKKAALIRLEDVSAGGAMTGSEYLEKFKILGDFLYSKGVKFHLGWVPRYINPGDKIDNNLLTNDFINNVQFINMLDHMIYRGAVVGLHGYTHQSGDSVSTSGNEMGRNINNTEEATRYIAENALMTAKQLNIPIDFFESPHYHATRKQQRILEEYFNILYEPYTGYWNLNPLFDPENKSSLYVPAPLGYVTDEHGEKICDRIREFPDWILSSLFFHPFKEMDFITIGNLDDKGYVDYTYNNNSPMKNIVKTLKETNHKTITVKELR